MSLWWIFSVLIAERFLELRIAEKNRKILLDSGGREFFAETYPTMVGMHVLFFVALIVESHPWQIPLNALTWFSLAMFVLLQALRYWCIASLGNNWNTRIILVPNGEVCTCGPYRYLRHPNYLAVVLEFAIIPLLARAPLTLVVFSLVNLLILRQRITLEELVLKKYTDYENVLITKGNKRQAL